MSYGSVSVSWLFDLQFCSFSARYAVFSRSPSIHLKEYFVNKAKNCIWKLCIYYKKLHIQLKNCKSAENNYDIMNSNSSPNIAGGTPCRVGNWKHCVENNRNSWGSKVHKCRCLLQHRALALISLGKYVPIEFSRNTQRWQYSHLYYYQFHYRQLSENRCEWGVNVNLWMGYRKWILIDSWWWLDIFFLLAWIRKLAVQHFYTWGLKSIH